MTRVARLVAATLAVVLALFPLAMERCRTACATPAPQADATPSAHACHEVAADERTVVVTPLPRTCGHSDEARIADAVALAAVRTRVAVEAPQAILSAELSSLALGLFVHSPPGTEPDFDRVRLPRHLPLRV